MKRKSVFTQIVFVLFLISVVPVSLITYYNGRTAQKNSEKIIADQAQEKLKADGRLSDSMLSNIIYLSMDFVLLKQYKQLETVKSYEELVSNYDSAVASLRIYDDLENMVRRNDLIQSAFYCAEDKDYVISSGTDAVIKKETFPNLDWLRSTKEHMSGAQGIWVSRKAEERGTEVNVLSYVYHISSLYTATNGIIVINLYEDEVSRLISSEQEEALIGGGLLTSEGTVLCHSDKTLLNQNLKELPYIETVTSSKESSGWGIAGQDGEKLLYTYQESGLYDWWYVNVYSYDRLFANSARKLKQSLVLACGILFLGTVLIVSIAYKVSRKLRRVIQEIGAVVNTPFKGKNGANEFEYLGELVGEIKDSQGKLYQTLHEREDAAFKTAIQNLLVGEKMSEVEQELLHSRFPYRYFMVCTLIIDDRTSYYKEFTREIREYHRWTLCEMVKTCFPEEIAAVSARYSSSSIAVILNLRQYDQDDAAQMVKSAAAGIQRQAGEALGLSLSVGVSGMQEGFEHVWIGAEEAFEATKQRLFVGAGQIIFFEKTDQNKAKTFVSNLYEKKIFNYLEIGDIAAIRRELRLMAEDMKGTDCVREDQIMLIFNQIIGKIMIYLNENNYNGNRIFGVQYNLYDALNQKETLDGIAAYLGDVFETIVRYERREDSGKEESICNRVMIYLQEHYKEDIDFETVAEKNGISYSHLRKVIRLETGKSLLDNLNMMRIDAVKKDLLATDKPLAEIAERNGYHNIQALNRFFRKFEGMSPGEYREKKRSDYGSD